MHDNREQIDALCHEARIHWDEATKKAKALEAEIQRLKLAGYDGHAGAGEDAPLKS